MNEVTKYENQEMKLIQKNLDSFDLFKNEIDIKSHNIFEISDPFEHSLSSIIENNLSFNISNLFDTGGNTLLALASKNLNPNTKVIDTNNATMYEIDFDSLTSDTKNKLLDGTFKMGESRKVEGNLRAVIVDSTNNKRIEDLTLKEVENKKSSYISENLITQAQLKQIYNLLLDIKESQDYQIKWNRNNSILAPFFQLGQKL